MELENPCNMKQKRVDHGYNWSNMTSEINSVTLITSVPMSLWPLSATISRILHGGQKPAIDERCAACTLVIIKDASSFVEIKEGNTQVRL